MIPSASAYLDRIGLRDFRGEPSVETLAALVRAHLLTVPFENLDIIDGRPIVLEIGALLDKVVTRRRGGFCYELNEAFGWLLRDIGFSVTRLAAQVFDDDGVLGPPFDHMALEVSAEELRPHLVDVGFGEGPRAPLPLEDGASTSAVGICWELRADGASFRLARVDASDGYLFARVARELADYEPMCRFHQTSSASPFTASRRCSLATEAGRVTVRDRHLITTVGLEQRREPIEDVASVLAKRFGVVL